MARPVFPHVGAGARALPALSALLGALAGACAGAGTGAHPPAPTGGPSQSLDADGVQMLLPPAPGLDFRLGGGDPNQTTGFQIEKETRALARREGGLAFWNVAAHDLDYASGGQGRTIRLHIRSGPDPQRFTWRTQRGFLSTPRDLRNQEVTVYLRVHGITDPRRAAISIKIRGGAHSAGDGDLASCVMMTFQADSTGAAARFGKELVHPLYDYVRLTPRLAAALTEDRWVGLKLVSTSVAGAPGRVANRLFIDVDPWDRAGRPRNGWQLLSAYVDAEGTGTGRYHKLVDWGGWVTTVRSDGVDNLDFALPSAREVAPPR